MLEKFHAHLLGVQYHRNHGIESRNCSNMWLYEENLNLFPAISEPDLLETNEGYSGFMVMQKSCLLCNKCVYDIIFVAILIINLIILKK